MKKIIYFLITVLFSNLSFGQNCVDFEGIYPISNWTIGCCLAQSIQTDSNPTYNRYLQLVDQSGGSFTVNKTSEFSGNWLLKGQSGCLCFDYKATWNTALPYPVSVPKMQIFYNTGTAINSLTGIHAAFVGNVGDPNIPINVWKKYCLPIGLSSGGNLPSNSYGTWNIYNASTQLTGVADATAWDNLIQNVSGIYLTTDYTADPSEVICFDNFCFTCTDGSNPNPVLTPPDPCCKNTLQMVTASAVPPSYPYNEGTYGVEQYNITAPSNIPITEIKVNVMSFEWKSDKEDCKQCQIKTANLGSLYGGMSIGGIFTGSTNQPYGIGTGATANNNEVVFTFPSGGKSLAVGDFMRLTYLLPPEKDLSCCQTKAHVCFKVSWIDINCGYCEVFTCSDVDLKNPSELKAGFPLPDRLMLYLNSRNLFVTGHADGF
jgi:hypothetical protein